MAIKIVGEKPIGSVLYIARDADNHRSIKWWVYNSRPEYNTPSNQWVNGHIGYIEQSTIIEWLGIDPFDGVPNTSAAIVEVKLS